ATNSTEDTLVTDFLIDLQSLSQLVSAHRRTSIIYFIEGSEYNSAKSFPLPI
ncbi:MAG: hypothetical protein ACI85F_002070, partial [Bacteroidia bacterium]